MLNELNPIAKKAKVQLVIETKDDGLMEVIVFFIVKDKDDKSLNIAPIRISGKPEEIDAEFLTTITQLVSRSLSPIERIAFVEESLKRAEKASSEAAAKPKSKAKGKTEAKTTTSKQTEIKVDIPKEPVKPKEPETLDMFATVPERGAPVQGMSTTSATLTATEVIVPKEDVEAMEVEQKEQAMEPSKLFLEREARLIALGFIKKEEEKQYVRGGIGLSIAYVEKATMAEFERGFQDLKTNINKSNGSLQPVEPKFIEPQAPKPTMSFSEFKDLGNDISFSEEKELAPAFVPPTPVAVPTPVAMPEPPKVKTMAERVADLKKLAVEYGFNPDSIADEQNEESLKFLENHILQNGVKQS